MPSYPQEDFEYPKQEKEQNPYPFYRKTSNTAYKFLDENMVEIIVNLDNLHSYRLANYNQEDQESTTKYYANVVLLLYDNSTEAEFNQAKREFKEFAKLL